MGTKNLDSASFDSLILKTSLVLRDDNLGLDLVESEVFGRSKRATTMCISHGGGTSRYSKYFTIFVHTRGTGRGFENRHALCTHVVGKALRKYELDI